MKTLIKWVFAAISIAYSLQVNAQHVLYIGTDKKADAAQGEATATLKFNLSHVIEMQKKMSEAESFLDFELKEQESFLLKRYPSEQQVDAYFKENPMVTTIFMQRFENQQNNLNHLRDQTNGWIYGQLFTKSINNIQNDMDDIMAQWKQATQVAGNPNRMSNAQRNSLMEETFERFKQVCVTTQQLKSTMKALSTRDKETIIQPNADGKKFE